MTKKTEIFESFAQCGVCGKPYSGDPCKTCGNTKGNETETNKELRLDMKEMIITINDQIITLEKKSNYLNDFANYDKTIIVIAKIFSIISMISSPVSFLISKEFVAPITFMTLSLLLLPCIQYFKNDKLSQEKKTKDISEKVLKLREIISTKGRNN